MFAVAFVFIGLLSMVTALDAKTGNRLQDKAADTVSGLQFVNSAGRKKLIKKLHPVFDKFKTDLSKYEKAFLQNTIKSNGIDFRFIDSNSKVGKKVYSELINLLQCDTDTKKRLLYKIWQQTGWELIILQKLPVLVKMLAMDKITFYTIEELKNGQVPFFYYQTNAKHPVTLEVNWRVSREDGRLKAYRGGKTVSYDSDKISFPYFVDYKGNEDAWLKRVQLRFSGIRNMLRDNLEKLNSTGYFHQRLAWSKQIVFYFYRQVIERYLESSANIQDPLLQWWFSGAAAYLSGDVIAQYFGKQRVQGSPADSRLPHLLRNSDRRKPVLAGWPNSSLQPQLTTDLFSDFERTVFAMELFNRVENEGGKGSVLKLVRASLLHKVLHSSLLFKLAKKTAGISLKKILNQYNKSLSVRYSGVKDKLKKLASLNYKEKFAFLIALLNHEPRNVKYHHAAAELILKAAAFKRDFDKAKYAVNHMVTEYYLTPGGSIPNYNVSNSDPFLLVVYAQFLNRLGVKFNVIDTFLKRALRINPAYQPAKTLQKVIRRQRSGKKPDTGKGKS